MSASLIKAALQVMKNAYAPYSQFCVGAAIEDEYGDIHIGTNVENAAYPCGICAETAAIAAMISKGRQQIRKIAIATTGTELCTPCGGCRQRIREFATSDTEIIICDHNGMSAHFTLDALLPKSFGPKNLK